MHGARFSPAFLDAVAAWAAEQQRRQSPCQPVQTASPPLQHPQAPREPPASAGVSTLAAAGTTDSAADEVADSRSGGEALPGGGSDAEGAAAASIGSAPSVDDSPQLEAENMLDGAASAAAGEYPAEDYSSAAWIAEALGQLRVGDDSEGSAVAAADAEGGTARQGGHSAAAIASLQSRGGGVQPSSSDDTGEVTSSYMGPAGSHVSTACAAL